MSKTETTSDAEITITTPFGASADVPEVAKLDAGTTPPAITQMVDAIAARIAAEDHPFANVARVKDPTPEEVAAMERELAENAEREAAASEPVLRVDNVTPNMDMTINLPKLAAAIDALGKLRATVAGEPEVAAAVERAGEQDTKAEVLAGLVAARALSTKADTVAAIAEFEEHYASVVGA